MSKPIKRRKRHTSPLGIAKALRAPLNEKTEADTPPAPPVVETCANHTHELPETPAPVGETHGPEILINLSSHETILLETAIPYVKGVHDSTGEYPSVDDLKRFLRCGTSGACRVMSAIREGRMILQSERADKRHDNAVAKALHDTATGETQFKSTEEYYIRENARLTRLAEKRRLDVSAERKMKVHLAANHAGYDELLANCKEFVNLFGDYSLPIEYLKPQPQVVGAVGTGHSEDAVLLLSDQHFGDVTRPDDTSGFPEYDLVIGGNRFGYVIGKAKQVLTLHRGMYPIKKLYVWVGGDVGNGVLHDSPNSNALFIPAQIHFSYHMMKFAIEDLLSLTVPDPQTGVQVVEEIVLLFSVGNHMRMDIHMPMKYQAQRTFDWLIYQFIIERFKGTPRVTIHETMSPFIFENIRGHRHLFAHGSQVGFCNNPDGQNKAVGRFLALARGLFDSPEWRKKNDIQGETFSRACIGDIHIPLSFPRFKSNGSLNGQNELGTNWTLEPIPAGQQIWGVTDAHQETWAYFLECTHIQRDRNDYNNYGIFAADYTKRIGRC